MLSIHKWAAKSSEGTDGEETTLGFGKTGSPPSSARLSQDVSAGADPAIAFGIDSNARSRRRGGGAFPALFGYGRPVAQDSPPEAAGGAVPVGMFLRFDVEWKWGASAQVSEVEGRTRCRLRIEMRLNAFIAMATHTIAESWSSVRWARASA